MSAARYMLDTDTVIHIRKRRRATLDRFVSLGSGEAVISVVSYGELRFGAEKSRVRESALASLEAFAASILIEPLPILAGGVFGEIKAQLSRGGSLIGPNDLWIAAHARSAGLILVTNNEREFRRVPGLQVENWAA